MQQTAEKRKAAKLLFKPDSSWSGPKPGEPSFSPDDLIDAYQLGKAKNAEDSRAERAALSEKKFDAILRHATRATESVVAKMVSLDIRPMMVRLRFSDYESLELLITMPEKDWLADTALEVLDFSSNLEQEITEDNLHLSLHFCGVADTFNTELAIADGYSWEYKPLAKQNEA